MTQQNNMTASDQLFAYLSTKPKSWRKAGALATAKPIELQSQSPHQGKPQTMNWYVYNHA